MAVQYEVPHHWVGFHRTTAAVRQGSYRSLAAVANNFALESHIDMIAAELGIDPYEFRRKNLLTDDEASAAGHLKKDLQFHAVLDTVIERSGWRSPKPAPHVGRGLAVSNQKLGTGFSVALLLLMPDGRLAIRTGIPDAGVGAHTMLRQIAAETLTVPLESVEILVGNTDESPWDMGLGASRHTYIHGQAVLRAVGDLIEKAKNAISSTLDGAPVDLDLTGGRFVQGGAGVAWSFEDVARLLAPDEPLVVVGEYLHPGDEADTECFSAQVAEVQVDPETGQFHVLSLTTCNDAGRVLNPLMAEGQVEGAVIQGFGFGVMEEIRIDEGQVTNGHFGEYKIPTIADVPRLDRTLLEEVPGPGPFGARPIAEFAVAATAPAIANAVFDAVGVRVTETPITAERLYHLMRAEQLADVGEGTSR